MRKRTGIIVLLAACAAAVLGFNRFAARHYVVPILMYHSVHYGAPPQYRLAVSTESFERQMRFLKNHRYRVLPLEEVGRLIREKKRIPARTVAITFDDGYRDTYMFAYPILKKYGLPAAVFLITQEVDRRNKSGRRDRLNWQEVREMQDSGLITFGSHCLGPEPLINFRSQDEVRRQIFDSKKVLEERLRVPVNAFSYPEGRFNPAIRSMVIEAGYRLAVATSPGRRFPNDDAFALKRLRISATSDNLFVFWIETSGLYTFLKERRDKD